MLRRKEEYQHFFSLMTKVLGVEPFTGSPEEQQQLLSLIKNPDQPLNPDQEKQYASIQANLRHPDPEVQRLTRLAISLDILSRGENTKKIARKLTKCVQSHDISLSLRGKDLFRLSANQWQALGAALQQLLHITHLNLDSNDLFAWGAAEWQALGTVLQQSYVTHLNLSNNGLLFERNEDPTQWQALGAAILKQSRITHLNLSNNGVDDTCAQIPDRWKDFCNFCTAILKQSSITHFDLSNNLLFALSSAPTYWRQTFSAAIKDNFFLCQLDDETSRVMPPEVTAYLQRNRQLYDASESAKNVLAKDICTEQDFTLTIDSLDKAIALLNRDVCLMSKLPLVGQEQKNTSIITPEGLYQLDEDNNEYQCILDSNKLTFMNLGSFLNRAKDQMDQKISIKDELTFDQSEKLDQAVTLAQRWRQQMRALRTLQELSADPDYASNIDKREKAIAVIALFKEAGSDSPSSVQKRRQELQDLLERVYWKQVGWLKDQLNNFLKKPETRELSKKLFVDSYTELINQIINAYCAIPPHNPHYMEARNEAFQLEYKAYSEGGYTQQQALLYALPRLLDDQQHFIRLDSDTQKMVDDFLWEAAGMEGGGFKETLSLLPEPNKLALLQYVWLTEIKNIASELSETQSVSDTASAAGLFASARAGGLRDFLNKELNVQSGEYHKNTDSFNKAMETLWSDAQNKIPASQIKLDDHLISLKTAISHLSNEVYPLQPAPDSARKLP